MTLQGHKAYGIVGARIFWNEGQSLKAEAKSVGHLTFFTVVGVSSNHSLDQGPANFFCKGPDVKYFRVCGPDGVCGDYSTLTRSKKAAFLAVDYMQMKASDCVYQNRWPATFGSLGCCLLVPA